ncbi:MAG: glycosyltransferase [Bacteroidales bacterium]|nr:glycosyltransferase [Bacteroidales bacterium]
MSIVLIIIGISVSVNFFVWLLTPSFVGYKPLYLLIIFIFAYKILIRFIEWIFSISLSVPKKPEITKKWTVDILTTFCAGEPKAMIIDTLYAIKDISYPHNSFLCDEANDPELKAICQELGIVHVTREKKINAKAGNINNALQTVAHGEICLILDPDHVPQPNFLDEVLPFFEDENIGFVQVVQAYYNQDHTVIAYAAAQQTYQFYGPFMMGLNTLGAVPAIGANCTFRRSALDSIGGHAPGLTEDMHTAMLLHAKGWKSVYNPVIVAKGLVPWNYSGYCLQQLKWSRGTYSLLLTVLPKIWKQLSWKQLAYYLSVPVFYLFGLVAILDFLIPIAALLFSIVPIKVSISEFLKYFLPFFIMSFTIRQFNQRWLLEKHEKGAFIFGGTLFKSAWWATLLGLVYAFVNKKVPYIPTPKDNGAETPIKLLLPNFIIIALSAFAIYYGLKKDFNPYSIFMAALAFTNILVLSLGNLMAMQHLIIKTHFIFRNSFISKNSKTRLFYKNLKERVFSIFQISTIPILVIVFISLIIFKNGESKRINELKNNTIKSTEFYIPNFKGSHIDALKSDCNIAFDTITFNTKFFEKASIFNTKCFKANKLPYIIIDVSENELRKINNNEYNSHLHKFFKTLRKNYLPIMLSLHLEESNTDSSSYNLSCGLNKLATQANKAFYPNVTWLWQTSNPNEDPYIQKNKYFLSWIIINESELKKIKIDKRKTAIPILSVYQRTIKTWNPTDISIIEAFDFSIFNNQTVPEIAHNKQINQEYIKGVAYNPGHDWRDNKENIPLTIEKLEADFSSIKEMGANTIRRYSQSIYDQNILNTAKTYNLKVLYGFWFDPKTDFYKNINRTNRYKKMVLNFVEEHKNDTTIQSWSIGNETWGLLKRYYSEPYLSFVRKAYIEMISEISYKIKQIDTLHQVYVMEEHTPHLASAIYAFERFAPNIDAFGINSYYDQNISTLSQTMQEVAPDKQYLISEFGPDGYWHKEYNKYVYDTLYYEQNSFEKAESFIYQWDNYINNKKNVIGAIAFCWQDRFEGTATWFGITDLYGNTKPSWYALKHCYTYSNKELKYPIPHFTIISPEEILWQGQNITFFAASTNLTAKKELYFKWMIYEEFTFKKIVETNYEKGKFSFSYKIPDGNYKYRIYLYVSDLNGNTITESKPIIISKIK